MLVPRSPPGLLSIVIPFYNEAQVLPELRRVLPAAIEPLPCDIEFVFIDDGSSDQTAAGLLEWAKSDRRVKVIGLARNFGHQAAVTAGLDAASGDAVVIMDADLQDPPHLISDMLDQYIKGYDVVHARRAARHGEGRLKRFTAFAFYRLMCAFIHRDLPADCGDFRLISRRCLDSLRAMRETHRFLRGMVAWTGFPQAFVIFDRPPRAAGDTKYSARKMFALAWTAAISFSPAPLRMSLLAGAALAFFGLADGVYAVGRWFLGYYNVPGWTSLMAALCLIGGGILLSIGILGEYVGRIFEEIKGRPLYIISLSANFDVPAPRATPRLQVTIADAVVHPSQNRTVHS